MPLDATLAHSPPKPPISKFKASLVTRHDSKTPAPVTEANRPPSSSRQSTSLRSATLGTSVLPPDALSKSIKLGKLVDGQLVAGSHDEEEINREEQDEEEIRKLLLKSMEEYSGIAAQIMGPVAKGSHWAKSETHDEHASSRTPPPTKKAQTKGRDSRFKVNQVQSRTTSKTEIPSSAIDFEPSASTVIYGSVEAVSAPTKIISNRQSPSISSTSHSIVIDPPSMPSSSTIIESPSFRRSVSPSSSSVHGPTIIPIPSDQHSNRQTPVMADIVKERSVKHDASVNNGLEVRPQRVSRFKADRSGG